MFYNIALAWVQIQFMDKIYTYIKRLLSFSLCILIFLLSKQYVTIFISSPILLLIFSILHFRITNERPHYLFAFYRTETYFKKGGLRDLLRIFVILSGYIYDTILWLIWGIYLVFILFVDFIDFIKTILFWIIHAIIWLLLQYLPFLHLLYSVFIYYFIRWPWWLYQIAFYNLRYAFNRNSLKVSLIGTFLTVFIIFIFYFLEIYLEEVPGIIYIGIIIALLPLSWMQGEIANIRVRKLEQEPFGLVRNKFQNGIESVRSILFYITVFVVLLLVQLGFNLFGWIPGYGVIIGSLVFNINTFINLILIFLCVLIILGVMIIPSYRMFVPFSETSIKDTIKLIKIFPEKSLRFIAVLIPAIFYSIVVMVIPSIFVIVAYFLCITLKETVLEVRINKLKMEQSILKNPVEAYEVGKQIDQMNYLILYPSGIWQDMENRKSLKMENELYREDIEAREVELLSFKERVKKKISELDFQIKIKTSQNPSDISLSKMIAEKNVVQNQLKNYNSTQQINISKLKTDLAFLMLKTRQIPVLFFLAGLWFVIFIGLVFSFAFSYLGNVIHQVFIFRNTDTKYEWQKIIDQIKKDDRKQPLLGGTFFFITMAIIFLLSIKPEISSIISGFILNIFDF
jgi:hypothetical protein